jgi:hypothetical protein
LQIITYAKITVSFAGLPVFEPDATD